MSYIYHTNEWYLLSLQPFSRAIRFRLRTRGNGRMNRPRRDHYSTHFRDRRRIREDMTRTILRRIQVNQERCLFDQASRASFSWLPGHEMTLESSARSSALSSTHWERFFPPLSSSSSRVCDPSGTDIKSGFYSFHFLTDSNPSSFVPDLPNFQLFQLYFTDQASDVYLGLGRTVVESRVIRISVGADYARRQSALRWPQYRCTFNIKCDWFDPCFTLDA